MKLNNVYAVIPAYNAAQCLEGVVLDLRKAIPEISIIVVNDGSSDGTHIIIEKLKVVGLHNERNQGKGAALQKGFNVALKNKADTILTLDADGQHNPFESPQVLKKMEEEHLDLVIGSRMGNTQGMPIHRFLSNKITSKLISWRTQQSIPDSQSGFRAYRAKMLKVIRPHTRHFDFESEVLLKATCKGFRVGFVDIETIYKNCYQSSLRAADIFRFTQVYIRSFFW